MIGVVIGLEGGGSSTKGVAMTTDGTIIGSVCVEKPSNTFLNTIDEVVDGMKTVIDDLITSSEHHIIAIGCGMSGIEVTDTARITALTAALTAHTGVQHVVIDNDAIASAFVLSNRGAVVCIAGTGSAVRMVAPDRSFKRAGGWGHLLGDRGSGFAVAIGALQRVYDHEDGVEPIPLSDQVLVDAVAAHFGLEHRDDILPQLYDNFNKAHIASLTSRLAPLARSGNMVAIELFEKAGRDLCDMVMAVLPSSAGTREADRVDVVCIGSMWKSFDLLKSGFVADAPFRLLKPSVPAGVGAAVMTGRVAWVDDAATELC
ncbi:BadF/BadG/BcrA/BcrD ATPase family [Carpediemonas membranifera]|uniref:N-acetyl-D-glucosamine kinase n=1 Tax=Carpediemonas membranifera TaxID=201153 RepID=A0A8J6DYK5_9EUKA|nr:BadF/BadG/BcrA/BcrD ATPase family [Carpediemonas membranifera]|eukprot:KAG9392394.1 BadF/BadG/BcrA/BcrD ATPase family [Carpediemonas membranifera]